MIDNYIRGVIVLEGSLLSREYGIIYTIIRTQCILYTSYVLLLISVFRKELLTHVHHLIHLNLAISLFLGYATFVSGIENATSSRVCHNYCTVL